MPKDLIHSVDQTDAGSGKYESALDVSVDGARCG